MDWNLEPPTPSKREVWIEKKVDEWFAKMELFIDGKEVKGVNLSSYLDVDKLSEALSRRADKLYDEMVGEAQITAWEDRQASELD